jgi:hypothetical protein
MMHLLFRSLGEKTKKGLSEAQAEQDRQVDDYFHKDSKQLQETYEAELKAKERVPTDFDTVEEKEAKQAAKRAVADALRAKREEAAKAALQAKEARMLQLMLKSRRKGKLAVIKQNHAAHKAEGRALDLLVVDRSDPTQARGFGFAKDGDGAVDLLQEQPSYRARCDQLYGKQRRV